MHSSSRNALHVHLAHFRLVFLGGNPTTSCFYFCRVTLTSVSCPPNPTVTTTLSCAVPSFCPAADPAEEAKSALLHCTNLHLSIVPRVHDVMCTGPRGEERDSCVCPGIICNLRFCLFFLTPDGIPPLSSKSSNYLNLDVKTVFPFSIRGLLSPPASPLMPVFAIAGKRSWGSSLAQPALSGSITAGV